VKEFCRKSYVRYVCKTVGRDFLKGEKKQGRGYPRKKSSQRAGKGELRHLSAGKGKDGPIAEERKVPQKFVGARKGNQATKEFSKTRSAASEVMLGRSG